VIGLLLPLGASVHWAGARLSLDCKTNSGAAEDQEMTAFGPDRAMERWGGVIDNTPDQNPPSRVGSRGVTRASALAFGGSGLLGLEKLIKASLIEGKNCWSNAASDAYPAVHGKV
jgi:hypothetical protein